MKIKPLTLSFLDLLFASFGCCILITIALTISVGRTEHQVEKDFLLVQVKWKESPQNINAQDCLWLENSDGKKIAWTYFSYPQKEIFFAIPKETGVHFLKTSVQEKIQYWIITTRKGKKVDSPVPSLMVRLEGR